MINLSAVKKPIFFIGAVVLIALYALSIYFINKYYYPDLNSESVKFFITDKERVSDQENVAFAIIGLNAPAGTKNIHSFGLGLVTKSFARYSDVDGKHISQSASLPKIENELIFDGEPDKLNCWTNKSTTHGDKCYSPEELDSVVSKNRLLLDRYEEIKKYNKYYGYVMFNRNSQLLINIHKLFLADIRNSLNKEGNKKAFARLINDMQYRKLMLAQPGTWIDKAINLVIYGLSYNQFEYAVTEHTYIVVNYDKSSIDTLSNLTMNDFNIDGVFRGEFEILNSLFCLDDRLGIKTSYMCQAENKEIDISVHYIMNRFYKKYLSYRHMTALDIDNLMTRCESQPTFQKVDFYFGLALHFPILTTYAPYKLLEDGSEKSCSIMIMYKLQIAKFRQSKIYLDVKRNKINEENINNYLQTTAERDYLTGMPFIYDDENKMLRFPKEAPADKVAELGLKM